MKVLGVALYDSKSAVPPPVALTMAAETVREGASPHQHGRAFFACRASRRLPAIRGSTGAAGSHGLAGAELRPQTTHVRPPSPLGVHQRLLHRSHAATLVHAAWYARLPLQAG